MYVSITKNPAEAARYIKEGRIVAVPTGTAYALACDALQGHALQRLRILKQRPPEKTFTVFLKEDLLPRYFEISEDEQALLEKYHGQALTLLLKPKPALKHLAQDDRVGLRLIDHPLMKELAEAVNIPLTATSANISSNSPAYSPEEILKQFPATSAPFNTTYNLSLATILDGGTLPQNPTTTIAKFENEKIEIIRRGTLPFTSDHTPGNNHV